MSGLRQWAERELTETRERTLPAARRLKYLARRLQGHLEGGGEKAVNYGRDIDEMERLLSSRGAAYGFMAKLQEDALRERGEDEF